MLKKKIVKKVLITSAVLFAFLLMCLIPNKENLKVNEELEYVNNDLKTSYIYLLDKNNMLARTKVVVSSDDKEQKAKELLNILISSKDENKIPNGFKAVLNESTIVNSLLYKDGLIKVDFSQDLLSVKKDKEEQIIESIVYTLTSIEDVNKIIIYINGNILTKLPKSHKNLPSTLDRSYGINKSYDINTYKDITATTIYYLNKYNDTTYYVPVTKYMNDDRDKVEIIIEQLTSGLYSGNLMSYLNDNTKLLETSYQDDSIVLAFNESIFSDKDKRTILDEVSTAITLSVIDNYDVNEVILKYKQEEICKSTLKTIE